MSLNVLFTVQSEGRGHMTQALALKELLEAAGHRVGGVLVGRSAHREVPGFFLEKIEAPVTYFDSPNFFVDRQGRGVEFGATIWKNARIIGRFRRSFRVIDRVVRRVRPDVIVNFYEVLSGLYAACYRPAAPMVCIGHQYMFRHPAYRFPPGHFWNRLVTRGFTATTSLGACRRLALSLYPAPDLPQKNISVLPPLLRPRLFELPLGRSEPFFLVYLLNSGYAEEIIRWHEKRPDVPLHCFWDRAGAQPVEHYDDTLTFHTIDDEKFLSMMARCRGLVTTAGFESVGEAMYLGKPVLMVPVDRHYEQRCNALDGWRAGAGLPSSAFAIDAFTDFLGRYNSPAPRFRAWLRKGKKRFVDEIEHVAGIPRRRVYSPSLSGDGAAVQANLIRE